MVTVDGQRYLVSVFGDDVQWVKNVRSWRASSIEQRWAGGDPS
jgi:hypothetical protein